MTMHLTMPTTSTRKWMAASAEVNSQLVKALKDAKATAKRRREWRDRAATGRNPNLSQEVRNKRAVQAKGGGRA